MSFANAADHTLRVRVDEREAACNAPRLHYPNPKEKLQFQVIRSRYARVHSTKLGCKFLDLWREGFVMLNGGPSFAKPFLCS